MSTATSKPRAWTFMVYMAGDNGKVFQTTSGPIRLMAEMTSAGYKDIWKMGQVGSTPAVGVTCLFDTIHGSYLVEVRKGNGMSNSVVQPMGNVNMGDPESLRDFIIRSVMNFPAEHYALVLWNHGLGWLDVDIYARVRTNGRASGGAAAPAAAATAPARPALFRSTPAKMLGGEPTRPIAFDDTSKDFLDTEGLRSALAEAEAATGRRLDLVGMDACLMAMIEGARELAPFADYFVASQEVEPMEGWPYSAILKAVNAQPSMAPRQVAEAIVDQYAASYAAASRSEVEPVTQSAITTANTEATEALVRDLVDSLLLDPAPVLRSMAQRAADRALVFQDPYYRDLGSFAANLAADSTWVMHRNAQKVKAAAEALLANLADRTESGPVLRLGYLPAYERATGLSVFLPRMLSPMRREEAMKAYRKLLFPEHTGWDRLVEWLL